MKKILFLVVLMINFVAFSEMVTENIIKYIDTKDYNTAAKNLIVYQKEAKFETSSEKDAKETVKNISDIRDELIKNYKAVNISNYKETFSKTVNREEVQKLLAEEGLSPAGFVKILNNLDNESFLIDFITDSPEAEYGIYALRYSQNNDDSTIIIHISKENNVYKIDEVTNYR